MTEMKQRSLEEVRALSQEEAVEIMCQAGILGAGGTISSIEEDIVALEGAGHSLQEAEAEAEVR